MQDLNVLNDAIIPLQLKTGLSKGFSLPEVLHELGSDNVQSFEGLKAHQLQAVEYFMAQIAVLALDLSNATDSALDACPEQWRSWLLSIAPEQAWRLVVEDTTLPAFLQAAIDEDTFANAQEKGVRLYPDEVTFLTMAKSHTTKYSTFVDCMPWHWIASLLELQTLSGYSGSGHFGTPRMDGGWSTRVKVGLYSDVSASAIWREDVCRIVKALPSLYEKFPIFDREKGKIGALWAEPWNVDDKLSPDCLHPMYIDCNRRVRLLYVNDGRIGAVTPTSKAAHVDDMGLKGNFADPWAPLRVSAKKDEGVTALTPGEMTLELISQIAFSDGIMPPVSQDASLLPAGKTAYFRFQAVLAGSKGTTNGYADVLLPLPGKIAGMFKSRQSVEALGKDSAYLLTLAKEAESVLRSSVFKFCQVQTETIRWKDVPVSDSIYRQATSMLEAEVKARYFEFLWDYTASKDSSAWIDFLKKVSEKVFSGVTEGYCTKTQLRFKAQAISEGLFQGLWARKFNKEISA